MSRAPARALVGALALALVSACSLVLDTGELTKDFAATAAPDGGNVGLDGGSRVGPSSYRDAVLSDGPVAYFRLGETEAPAKSLVGGFSATATGTPTFGVAGAIAGDADFAFGPAGKGGLTAGNILDFTGTQPFSSEAWVSLTVIDDAYRFVFSKTVFVGGQREAYGLYVVRTDEGDRLVFERWTSGQRRMVSAPAPALDGYHHVATVYDGTALALFIDGVVAGTVPDDRSAAAKPIPFTIGTPPTPDVELQPLLGSIDELAIYDKPLRAERIAAHRNLGLGR